MGIIERSSSNWAAPVKKKDGMCVDYRRLNAVSPSDAYPMPRVDDLGGARYITTLDLSRGYTKSRHLTAFTTPFGLFQFKVMPFGLHGAPATFQRMMDRLLWDVPEFAAAYLDDLIIHSTTWEEHLKHVRIIFEKLRSAGLTIKPKKCQFGPEESKLQSVKNFPAKKQVRAFLGLTGYYRKSPISPLSQHP